MNREKDYEKEGIVHGEMIILVYRHKKKGACVETT